MITKIGKKYWKNYKYIENNNKAIENNENVTENITRRYLTLPNVLHLQC